MGSFAGDTFSEEKVFPRAPFKKTLLAAGPPLTRRERPQAKLFDEGRGNNFDNAPQERGTKALLLKRPAKSEWPALPDMKRQAVWLAKAS